MVDKKHLQMPQRQLTTPKISERDFRVRILLQAELGREYSQAWRMKSRWRKRGVGGGRGGEGETVTP